MTRWFVGPRFDLACFVLAWPVLLGILAVSGYRSPVGDALTFWQVWFLTLPHRWITLPFVWLDPKQLAKRPGAFLRLAVVIGLIVASQLAVDPRLYLLIFIDFFWNAWHFAAQHAGIARIYERLCRPDRAGDGLYEKVLLRAFVLLVILRTATVPIPPAELPSWGWWYPLLYFHLPRLDPLLFALPVMILAREATLFRRADLSRLAYLVSILGLYTAVLVACRRSHERLMWFFLPTVVHSIEYFAIVSWSVQRSHPALPWVVTLALFMLLTGGLSWMAAGQLGAAFAALSLWVSFLHYAYDGLIWRAPSARA